MTNVSSERSTDSPFRRCSGLARRLALVLVLLCGVSTLSASIGDVRSAGNGRTAPRKGKRRIIINIPARKLRVYEGSRLLFECRTAVGRLRYPGVRHNTRTRVGRYRIARWIKDHRNRQYPVAWSKNCWRGAFGAWTATISPRSAGQHVHGTIGPVELKELFLERLAPRSPSKDESLRHYLRYLDGYEYGLSHGCTRVSNENIVKIMKLCPPGTEVWKIYCLHERLEKDADRPWLPHDIYYPNIYRYRIVGHPVFFPETGRLEGYVDPPDAVSYL